MMWLMENAKRARDSFTFAGESVIYRTDLLQFVKLMAAWERERYGPSF
jgi:hypothetical protein